MVNTSRTRYALAAVLGTAGIAAATFLGVHSGGVSISAVLAGIDGAEAFVVPAPAVDEPPTASGTETAVLAGGCFWGVQGVFQHVNGVTQAESGYAGGDAASAQYETVGRGDTGHAESVRITYDPTAVTFGRLLQIYFSVVADPTQLNRQGPDSGTQYRSAIFAQNADQQRVARAYIDQLSQAAAFPAPIVTTIEPNTGFFPAEGYHQNYLDTHPTSAYIAMNDMPKVADMARLFPQQYRDKPVLMPVDG
jgi:peptide-methionine (S)-S-oxide reductase